jgi:hypothetical protein
MLHDDAATLETALGVEEGLAKGKTFDVPIHEKAAASTHKKRIVLGLAVVMLAVIAGVIGFVVGDARKSNNSSLAAATFNMLQQGAPAQQGLLSTAKEQTFAVDCGAMSMFSQLGLFYSYHPERSGPVHAVVCSGAGVTVEVFAREMVTAAIDGSFSSFQCVKSAYSRGDIGNCDGTSISWEAQVNVEYVVLVSSSTEVAVEDLTDAFTIQLVDNDQCKYAAGPILPTSVGAIRSYTTADAQMNSEDEVAICGDASASTSAGVWYQVQGDGRTLTASTCVGENEDETASFDTQLSVFQGDDCGSLVCVDGNNDACGSQSIVEWQSVKGEVYHVFLHGANGATGDFRLSVSSDIPAPANDVCDTAETVVPSSKNSPIAFAFSGSTAEVDLPVCGDVVATTEDAGQTIGIWYKVVSTGVPVSATVSYTNTSPVTMTIFTTTSTGSGCNNGVGLVCVPDNSIERMMTAVGSGVSLSGQDIACFKTKEGEDYYILLSTHGNLEGSDEDHTLEFAECELSSV